MRARRILAAMAAAVMVPCGVSLAVAPTATAAACPDLSGLIPPFAVTPAPTPGVDWSRCILSLANLFNADLSSANLSYADLSGAGLSNANLSNANLSNASLPGGALSGTNLSNADLSNADLSDAAVFDANLTGANLTGANLTDANLADAFVACDDDGILGAGITGSPSFLPVGWVLADGTLTLPAVPCAATVDAPSIPAWVQAYGRADAEAPCIDGWNRSWQSWAEPITGGWVCTRSIPSLS